MYDTPDYCMATMADLSADEFDRSNATISLRDWATDDTVRARLIEALGDVDGRVRVAAALALGSVSNLMEVRCALAYAWQHDVREDVRLAANEALLEGHEEMETWLR